MADPRFSLTAPGYRSTLTTYLLPFRARVAWLAVVLVAATAFQVVVPLILQRFIDSALAAAPITALTSAGIAYLVVGVLQQGLSAVSTYLGADVGWRATNRLRHDLARHALGLDMGYHADTTPGEMIERIDGDVTAVSNFLSRFVVRLLGSALLLIGVVVVSAAQDWRMGAALAGYVAAVLTLMIRMRHLAERASEHERETSALLYGFIEERLDGLDDIRANGAGLHTMYVFVDVMRDFYRRTRRAWRTRAVFWVTSNTAYWTGDVIALAVGAWLALAGDITIGTAYLILQYVALVRTPIEQVAQEFQELQKAAGGILRIDALRARSSRMVDEGTESAPGDATVRFEGVRFAYEDRIVLDGVDFTIPDGTSLGLLGRTGGGKTTITRLLARLYDPTEGRVTIGGVDLRHLDRAALRRTVGVVTQDVQLFGATVRDNLTFFREDRDDESIIGVLDRVGLGDWIRQLGLHTELGSGGTGLSAGEAQLLAFARVFLQDPKVVILDEPSSRLDPMTESLIATATERIFAGRTAVIVAHRLETVRSVDSIMVVEAGRIVEHGARVDLAADPTSRYSRLLAAGQGRELS
ncbi:MAG TPA: ABC transporter ATP-binding protein [Acidimicrobiia bacterium]|nr:ABC transporter ATP-binding protein [Acidimicrobiia bacterium]